MVTKKIYKHKDTKTIYFVWIDDTKDYMWISSGDGVVPSGQKIYSVPEVLEEVKGD